MALLIAISWVKLVKSIGVGKQFEADRVTSGGSVALISLPIFAGRKAKNEAIIDNRYRF